MSDLAERLREIGRDLEHSELGTDHRPSDLEHAAAIVERASEPLVLEGTYEGVSVCRLCLSHYHGPCFSQCPSVEPINAS